MASPFRRTELGLLSMVAIVVGAAYTLASLGRTATIPANIGPFLGVVFALFLAAHLALRKFAPEADPLLVPLAAMLNGLGYVMIARLDAKLAAQQAAWTAVGVLGFIITLAVVKRARSLEHLRYTAALIGVVLVVLPLVPVIGRGRLGSLIWVKIGPINFQPGEFAKIALAVAFASYLFESREMIRSGTYRVGRFFAPDPRYALPLLAVWGVAVVVMVAEKDLGSALLFFVLFLTVLYVATSRASYVVAGLSLFAAAAFVAHQKFSHVQVRVATWLNPWPERFGKGIQVIEAAYALAWGGISGTGLGRGTSTKIPEVESDFIFAAIGEELGLIGVAAILAMYMLLCGAGFRAASMANDAFSKLLAVGLTSLLGFQTFIIIAGITRVLPLTGVTLPFVSYGGSSLVANWIIIALLARISNDTRSIRRQRHQRIAHRVAA